MDTAIVIGISALVVVWLFRAAKKADRKMLEVGQVRGEVLHAARNAEEMRQKTERIARLERELAALADDNEILRAQVNFSREPA